jgi:acyl CoA:acetate/3-ketoacid CoA transferase alpha subunit
MGAVCSRNVVLFYRISMTSRPSKDLDPSSRLATLGEAAALVSDGASLGLGGFSIARNSIAFAHELIRCERRDLVVSQTIAGLETDLLVGAGCVRRLVYAGGSLDRFGQLARIAEAIEAGRLEVEAYSGLSLVLRYLAGGLGLPFVATKSLLRSDILSQLLAGAAHAVRASTSPFGGDDVVLLAPLTPDFAIVTVQLADSRGNYVIEGPTWDSHELIAAATHVILLAERVVETDELREHAAVVHAAPHTAAVVSAPWAAYPTSLYQVHDYDDDHLRRYVELSSSGEGFDRYLSEFVLSSVDHAQFIETALAGKRRVMLASYR